MNPLVWLLVIPVIGAIVAAVMPRHANVRGWALLVTLLEAVLGVYLLVRFDFAGGRGWQFTFTPADNSWLSIGSIGFHFSLGIDSISLWLVLLTVLLMPLAVAASFDTIQERQKEYYAWMLALMTAMLGVFVVRDLLLFYVFFELTLIPMFFIIGIWGGPERRYAAAKFFLFTFAGSVFTLAAVIYLGVKAGTFDLDAIVRVAQSTLTQRERWWVVLGLLAGFSVKVPLFPVHTWLPLAHTEAPTAGSVILAGVLLKLGTYGLLRLAVPIGLINSGGIAFPALTRFIAVLCVIGIVYGALIAWVQKDIKKLVAYSSVSHLGFCVLGLAALNAIGLQGSVLYMVNHGLSTGALFLCIGMIYDRYHTRDINELSGLARRMPVLAFFFVLFAMSSIGLPGLNGFSSEFLTILGAFTSENLGPKFAAVAALGVILGAVYMLHMVARVIWGPLKVPGGHGPVGHGHTAHGTAHGQADSGQGTSHDTQTVPGDINPREIAILVPLALAVVFLGFVPNSLIGPMREPLRLLREPVAQQPFETAKVVKPAPAIVQLAAER